MAEARVGADIRGLLAPVGTPRLPLCPVCEEVLELTEIGTDEALVATEAEPKYGEVVLPAVDVVVDEDSERVVHELAIERPLSEVGNVFCIFVMPGGAGLDGGRSGPTATGACIRAGSIPPFWSR